MKFAQHSIADARNRLPALVHEAEGGTVVELTRRGKAVAILLSKTDYERLTRGRPDLLTALSRFRETHDLGALRADEVFADVRDKALPREMKW